MVVILSILMILDLCFENSGSQAEFQAVGHFLAPYLTGSIGKKSSGQLDYTPNR